MPAPAGPRGSLTRHAASAPLLAELRRALKGECRVPAGSHLLVAVSGGPDSVALLHALAQVARTYPLRLCAAHLHHGLRGREADADLALVRRQCRRLGVPLAAARWNTRARMKRRGLSGQAGLRALRREFLLAAAGRRHAELVATAHTADDQLETLLLRLARGAGLRGLAGIPPRAGRFVRPLLGVPREDVLRYLRGQRLAWREDRSNRDLAYARSRVRSRVVPQLARVQGRAGREALARSAARTARELRLVHRALHASARRAFASCAHPKGSWIRVDCKKAMTYASSTRRELVRIAWARSGAASGLTLRHLEAIEGLMAGAQGRGELHLPDGRVARREGGCLWVVRPRKPAAGGTGRGSGGRSRKTMGRSRLARRRAG